MNNYSRLSLEELQYIYKCKRAGKSNKYIAKALKRSDSTIGRLLRRYKHPFPVIWRDMDSYERARWIFEKGKKVASNSRKRNRLKTEDLRGFVVKKLTKDDWTPEEISGALKYENAFNGLYVSFKTIYNFIHHEKKYLLDCLPRKGVAYSNGFLSRNQKRKPNRKEKRLITKRSKKANLRLEYGHWEIDTIHSCKGGSRAILTLRERKSRRVFFFILPDLKAESVMAFLVPFFRSLPRHMRRTLTSDNGSEFTVTEMGKLEEGLERFKLYYCHAYSAHERGSVEHANGMLRRYYPKGTDFGTVTGEALKEKERKINAKPMKLHKFKTPQAVYERAFKYVKAA